MESEEKFPRDITEPKRKNANSIEVSPSGAARKLAVAVSD